MLSFSAQTVIYIFHAAVDFRNGIEGIGAICRNVIKLDPEKGAVFVFRNRQTNALKLLFYDGQGYWLCHKRMSKGKFRHWPAGDESMTSFGVVELLMLINNGDPMSKKFQLPWKRI